MSRLAFVAACLLVFNGAVTKAAVIYDFESPAYSIGAINGQNGWTGSAGSAQIVDDGSGNQILDISGDANATHSLAGSGFANTTTVSALSSVSWAANSYAEILMFDSSNTEYARAAIQFSNGNSNNRKFYVRDNAGFPTFSVGSVNNDTVYAVEMTLDFVAQQYRVTFTDTTNNTLAGDSGFVNFVAATTVANAEAGKILLDGGTPSGGAGRFDNVSVVPEPCSFVMGSFGLVAVGLAAAYRRKK